jgi:hypothetical protein
MRRLVQPPMTTCGHRFSLPTVMMSLPLLGGSCTSCKPRCWNTARLGNQRPPFSPICFSSVYLGRFVSCSQRTTQRTCVPLLTRLIASLPCTGPRHMRHCFQRQGTGSRPGGGYRQRQEEKEDSVAQAAAAAGGVGEAKRP